MRYVWDQREESRYILENEPPISIAIYSYAYRQSGLAIILLML